MKKTFKIVILFLIFACLCGCAKEDFSADFILNPDFPELIQEIESALLEKKFQGSILISKNNNVIYAKGFGLSDSKNPSSNPITISSTFEIGSITKQMTAAAIMQLAEQKKLTVNDKLSLYFPDYKYADEITIDMLLRMRSGLIDMINAPDEFFPRSVLKKMDKMMYSGKPLEDGFVLKYFYDAPLLSKPDSTYFYCNTNYYLLARIIEKVSGISYYEYLQKNIFAPAEMASTNINFQQTDTRGYDWKKRYYSFPSELSLGCGDINSNVIDLYKWNKALREGKIVKKKTYKKMIDTNSYGYGLNNQNGEIFHAGVTAVFNSYMTYYPEQKITIIVLINQPVSEKNASSVSREIYRILDKSSLKN